MAKIGPPPTDLSFSEGRFPPVSVRTPLLEPRHRWSEPVVRLGLGTFELTNISLAVIGHL